MRSTCTLTRLAVFVVIAASSVALAGCDVVVSSLDAKGKAEDVWTRNYPVTSGQLEIVNGNGSVDVVGGTGSQVEVVAERKAKAMTDDDAKKVLTELSIGETVTANKVRLETKAPTGEGRNITIKYHVKVPAGVNVSVQNTNGTVEVSSVKGQVHAETSNGTVKGRDLSGAVTASTTNGAVQLEMLAIVGDGVKAETVNGTVQVTMPAAAKANVRATCVNGHISVDGLHLDGPEPTRRRVEGRANGGGPDVVLETTNGRIQLTGK